MKAFVCMLVFCCAIVFAKGDTITVVTCKCDTIKIVRDTTFTVSLDTLKKAKAVAPVKVKK